MNTDCERLSMMTGDTTLQLSDFTSATIGSVVPAPSVFDPGLHPLFTPLHMAGPAFPVAIDPGHNLAVHLALAEVPKGVVLVIATGADRSRAVIGDLMALAAKGRGIAGIITDGAIRDSRAIRELGVPVLYGGISIRAMAKEQPGRVNEPIGLCGVTVNPGDVIVADEDGAVVLEPGRMEEAVNAARRREEREADVRRGLRQGRTTVELLGLQSPQPPGGNP